MFNADGDYIYEHDLESGDWDGHSYDCSFPNAPCDCEGPEFGLAWIDEEGDFHANFLDDDEEEFEDVDDWIDYATYVDGR